MAPLPCHKKDKKHTLYNNKYDKEQYTMKLKLYYKNCTPSLIST